MILKRIHKGPGKEIRLTLISRKGAGAVDIREWTRLESGKWHPTKKKITVRADWLIG